MQRRHAAAIASVTLLFASLGAAYGIGLRFNYTSSMPTGVWRVVAPQRPLRIGSVLVVCPPDNEAVRQAVARGYIATGSCPDAREPLLKTVGALGGDVVAVMDAGVSVDGTLLTGTVPLKRDGAGRELTWFATSNYRLRPDEVWLTASANPRSFDSRYFGPVPVSHVIGLAQPIWTFQ